MSLISIVTPCYNSSKTLSLALASLIAQTYENWECLVVDDGSDDHPDRFIQHLNDSRIRYIRLDKNYGRGFARQIALDNARGDFLCMLDADDWYYPAKLQNQLLLMEANKDLALVSSGMAIVDGNYNIVGARVPQGNGGDFCRFPPMPFGLVPFPFAPSIMRTQIAKKHRFDQRLRRAEDADFLLHILLEHPYGIHSELNYVYTELNSVDIQNVVHSIKSMRLIVKKYKKIFPITSRFLSLELFLKSFAYRFLFRLGIHEQIILRRSQQVSVEIKASFDSVRSTVFCVHSQLFSDFYIQAEANHDE